MSRRYTPSIVSGTSAGAIVGALFAARVTQAKTEAAVMRFDWFRDVTNLQDTVKSLLEARRGGPVSNRRLSETINEVIQVRTFSDLDLELSVT